MLEEKLVESLDQVAVWVESVEGFAVEQVPLVVQEVLLLATVEASVVLAVVSVIPIVCLLLTRFLYKLHVKYAEIHDEYDGWVLFPIIVSLVLAIGSFAIVTQQLIDLLSVLLAPRLYVLEYLRDLI